MQRDLFLEDSKFKRHSYIRPTWTLMNKSDLCLKTPQCGELANAELARKERVVNLPSSSVISW